MFNLPVVANSHSESLCLQTENTSVLRAQKCSYTQPKKLEPKTVWDSFPYWRGEIAHHPHFSGLPIYLKYSFFLTNYTCYSRYDWGWVFQTHEQLPSVIQEAACAQFMWRFCTNPSPSPNSEETPYKDLTHNEWLGWLWHKEDYYSDSFLCKTVC